MRSPCRWCTEAIRRLHAMGKTVVLDPAPAAAVPEDVLAMVDYITPNESELRAITPSLGAEADAPARVRYLLDMGVGCVINKSGGDGAYVAARGAQVVHVPGFRVKVVDTTAAGDTFNAGFAAGLALGLSLEEAVKVGHAAAALSVTAFGAQGGMPPSRQLLTLPGRRMAGKTGAVNRYTYSRELAGRMFFGKLSSSLPAIQSTPADGRRPGRLRGRTRPRGCARSCGTSRRARCRA